MRNEDCEPASAAPRPGHEFTCSARLTANGSVPPAGPALTRLADTGPEYRIQQCIAFMSQHLDQPLQVATLAAQASTSPSHFFLLFKRFTGSPPMDYFIRLRMQRACQLLARGRLPVKEVAAAVGYEDPFYFSRAFKCVHRVAPTEYRTRAQTAGTD